MKKILVLVFGVLAVGQVFAGTICTLGAPTAANFAHVAGNFVVRDFPVKCSANVDATHSETAVAFGVGALSTKGKSYFIGTTAGGQVSGTACGVTCVAGGQAAALATAMLTAT
jgi:hypothetical protein